MSESRPALPWPALVAGVLAAAAAGAAWQARDEARAMSERLARVEAALGVEARAASEVRELRPPAVPPGRNPVVGEGSPAADGEMIRRLEARIAELEKAAAPVVDPGGEFPGAAVTPERVEECQAILRDPYRDIWSKLRALRSLWMGAPEARTAEVTRGLLDRVRTEEDPEIRGEILTGMFGVEDPEWRYEFLRRLASDPDPKVRKAAAFSLGPLAGDPDVLAALEAAAKNDESEKVRKQAGVSLKLPLR